jgi:hypothetical protein
MVAGLRRAKFDQQVLWPEADAANHDFIWCENVIKEHSGSFYRAFSHLGYNEARAVYAIYAFAEPPMMLLMNIMTLLSSRSCRPISISSPPVLQLMSLCGVR